MHVALFTDFHPDTPGGIQTAVDAHRRALLRAGHRVTVFTAPAAESAGTETDLVEFAAPPLLQVNGYAAVLPTPANRRRIDAAFAARGPIDLVHVHTTYGVGVLGVDAARRHGIPLVQTLHSRDDVFIRRTSPVPYLSALALRTVHGRFVSHRGRMPRVTESRAARHAWRTMQAQAQAADAVIVPSDHFARRLREHGYARPVAVIGGGIDDELLALARATPRTPSEVGEPLRVLYCGRLSAEKRPLAAVEAVRLAGGCILDVAGDGAHMAQMRSAAVGLNDRIRFHGALDQPACLRLMRRADVLLFPSLGFDTQGITLIEAAAMGLPAIYCDPDLAETVPAGGGVLTGAGPPALAVTLRRLADDRDQLRTMRETLSTITDSIRQSTPTARTVTLYRELIDAAETRRSTMPGSLADVPAAPGAVPVLGHGAAALRDSLGFVRSLADIGPIVRIRLGPRVAYVVTTPELIREVGFGTAGEFHRDDLREAVHEAIRGASNVLSGKPHEVRRRMIAPALRQRRIAEYASVTTDIAGSWADALPAGREIDLVEQAHALVLDTISATLFTADFGADAAREVRENIPWLLGQVIQRAALPPPVRRLRVPANRRFAAKAGSLRQEIGAVVTAYRLADTDFHDVLSALVGHVDPDTGERLDDDAIIDELILMLAAGVGSTASILSWVWYETLRDPAIADAVRAELAAVVGAGPLRAEHVAELPYLRQVITETLRMWGPWISMQTADGPVELGGLTLPDGTVVMYSPYLVHHDPRYYVDPEHFDPERWAPDRVAEIDRKAVLPFGVGNRHCPGNNFALMTITLATAALLRRWSPALRPGARVTPSSRDFVAAPSKLPVTLRPA